MSGEAGREDLPIPWARHDRAAIAGKLIGEILGIADAQDLGRWVTWGVRDKKVYLLGLLRQRLEYPALKRAVREQQNLYHATEIVIEDKASGTQLIQELIADGRHGVTR